MNRLMIDCGKASRMTKGISYLFIYELGAPPNDRLYNY